MYIEDWYQTSGVSNSKITKIRFIPSGTEVLGVIFTRLNESSDPKTSNKQLVLVKFQ